MKKCRPFVLLMSLFVAMPVMAQDAEPDPGEQVEASLTSSDRGQVGYLISFPDNYDDDGEPVPLLLFLHGRGESYGLLSLVAKWGPPMMAEQGEPLPFLVVSPQCPGDDRWTSETQQTRLIELLDHIVKSYNVDESRIYLTGLSMGGYGSWRLAADHPERFAAVVPVCGAGDPADAEKLKAIPIWVFHGDQDRAVPFATSEAMVDAIKAAGGDRIRFTTLEHIGHNSWSAAYSTPELYQWLAEQHR